MTDLVELEAELELTLAQLNTLEGRVRTLARDQGGDYMMVMDTNGRLMMIDIVVGKAQVLPALRACKEARKAEEAGAKVKNWFEGLASPKDVVTDTAFCDVCHEEINLQMGGYWTHPNGFKRSEIPELHDAIPE